MDIQRWRSRCRLPPHYLSESLAFTARPHVVAIQEVCCNCSEWKSTLHRMDKLGYAVYACDNVVKGLGTNGIMTFVSQQLRSKQVDAFSGQRGLSALAVEIEDILHVNSYCPPHED